jgi:hypothetical protein
VKNANPYRGNTHKHRKKPELMKRGVNNMKKFLLGTILLTLAIVVPIPTIAGVNISIGISLPPPIVFEAPPDVIVIPDTNNVYVFILM